MLNTEDARRLLAIARRAASEAAAAVRAEPAPHLYTGTINEGGDRVLVIDMRRALALQPRDLALQSGLAHRAAVT